MSIQVTSKALLLLVATVALGACSRNAILPKDLKTGQADKNWCSVVQGTLGGFKCSELAGETQVGMFGTGKNLDKSLAQFAPNKSLNEFTLTSDDAQVAKYSEDWRSYYDGKVGLPLDKISSWLPKAELTSEKDDTVNIGIEIQNSRIMRISNLALTVKTMRGSSNASKEAIGTLNDLLTYFCSPVNEVVYEVIIGRPVVTFVSRSKLKIGAVVGWVVKDGVIGIDGKGGYDGGFSLKMERNPTATDVVLAEKRILTQPDFSTLKLCGT